MRDPLCQDRHGSDPTSRTSAGPYLVGQKADLGHLRYLLGTRRYLKPPWGDLQAKQCNSNRSWQSVRALCSIFGYLHSLSLDLIVDSHGYMVENAQSGADLVRKVNFIEVGVFPCLELFFQDGANFDIPKLHRY